MRPPPFILVLKSNAPGSSETAITKGGRIMFREKKSGAEMENMAALWTSVFSSRPSPARAPQRRHPGLLGPPVPCIQSSHTGRHRGSTAGFLFLVCKGTAAFSFSADKVGPGFRPQKGVWQPLAASQTLCLPHPRVGKIALPDRLLLTATDALPHCGKTQHFYFICFFYHSPPRL